MENPHNVITEKSCGFELTEKHSGRALLFHEVF